MNEQTKTNADDLAFPRIGHEYPVINSGETKSGWDFSYAHAGLTKREYFAAMAMQGLCVNNSGDTYKSEDLLAKQAVETADALINELNK